MVTNMNSGNDKTMKLARWFFTALLLVCRYVSSLNANSLNVTYTHKSRQYVCVDEQTLIRLRVNWSTSSIKNPPNLKSLLTPSIFRTNEYQNKRVLNKQDTDLSTENLQSTTGKYTADFSVLRLFKTTIKPLSSNHFNATFEDSTM